MIIKYLIKDLAYENISLTQALTRTKIIAHKVNNEELKIWLLNELNGYSTQKNFPSYRIVESETVGFVNSVQGTREIPISLGENSKELDIDIF
jgi:hypothetical protein